MIKNWEKFNENKSDFDNDILNPKFSDNNTVEFLIRLGVNIKEEDPNHDRASIRNMIKYTLYSFREIEDFEAFKEYLADKDFKYEERYQKDSINPYRIIFEK